MSALLGVFMAAIVAVVLLGVYEVGFIAAQLEVNRRVFGRWLDRQKAEIPAADHARWMADSEAYDRAWSDYRTIEYPSDALASRLQRSWNALLKRGSSRRGAGR